MIRREYIILLLFLVYGDMAILFAQEPPEPDPPPPPPPGFPIDDHLWILILAGLLLGFFYLRKKINATA